MNTAWNSETQAIHNWIESHSSFTETIHRLVCISYIRAKACDTFTKEQNATSILSHAFEEFFEDLIENYNSSDAKASTDLLNLNYLNVKWDDLAKLYISKVEVE